MNPIKKQLLVATILSCAAFATASAQTALFSYNDGNGVPNAGTYIPGSSFSFTIMLTFAPGGAVTNLEGLSYWFQQKTPAGAPFPFAITLRDVTGSDFTDLQTPGLTYPQNLNPSNANDLGAAIPVGNPADGAGSYLIANVTVSIDENAPINNAVFVLSQTIAGGKTSVISDSAGHTFAIPEADYTVTLVPEPGTWASAALVVVALVYSQRRRFQKA